MAMCQWGRVRPRTTLSEHSDDGFEYPELFSHDQKYERTDDPKLDPERTDGGVKVRFRGERVVVGARGGECVEGAFGHVEVPV